MGSGMRVGDRLRAIRRQKGLSLHDVEARSGMEFKASVLGAYERGERAISVPRLLRLAEIYQVPGDQLLPRIPSVRVLLDGADPSEVLVSLNDQLLQAALLGLHLAVIDRLHPAVSLDSLISPSNSLLFCTLASKRSSGRGAGPETTLPSMENTELWHGQRNCFLASSK